MASRITEMKMKNRIKQVTAVLRENSEIDLKNFVWELVNKFGCSAKTAREYIKAAEWAVKNGAE